MSIAEGNVPTGEKPEYSWADLLDKVADLRDDRDRLCKELASERAKGLQLRLDLQDALAGERPKPDTG